MGQELRAGKRRGWRIRPARAGKLGTNYVLQYQSSLADPNWTPLLNFNLVLNPFINFDTTAMGVEHRYYRAYAY
jgi:hypothetical protein